MRGGVTVAGRQFHTAPVRLGHQEQIFVLAETLSVEQTAGAGDSTARQLWPAARAAAKIVADAVRGLPGVTVLELACGLGAPALAAKKAGARRVLASDRDATALACVEAAASRQGLQVETLELDLCGSDVLPVADLAIFADVAAGSDLVAAAARRAEESWISGASVLAAMQRDRAQRAPLWRELRRRAAMTGVLVVSHGTPPSPALRRAIAAARPTLVLVDVDEDDPSLYT